MRAPVKPKPRAADEVARVVRIMEMLTEEGLRTHPLPGDGLYHTVKIGGVTGDAILEVAERIAARTEG